MAGKAEKGEEAGMMDIERLGAEAAARGIEVSPEALEKVDRFCELVLEANRSFNLTAITGPEEMEEKKALDCLTVLPWLPGKAARCSYP